MEKLISGIAKFKVIASDGDIASRDEAIVPFIPGGPKETKVTRVEVPAGTTDLMPYLSGWEPTSERTTFWLTNNPYGEAFDHLKYLIRYPYGCIEQTTSSTRPLLFVSDILVQVAPEIAPKQEEIDKMVRHGILGVEMEAAELYTLAARHGRRALAVLTVSDHLQTGEALPSEDREKTFGDMVEIALKAAFA